MDRFEDQHEDDLIELGSVTAETRGPPVGGKDTHGGIALMGLTND